MVKIQGIITTTCILILIPSYLFKTDFVNQSKHVAFLNQQLNIFLSVDIPPKFIPHKDIKMLSCGLAMIPLWRQVNNIALLVTNWIAITHEKFSVIFEHNNNLIYCRIVIIVNHIADADNLFSDLDVDALFHIYLFYLFTLTLYARTMPQFADVMQFALHNTQQNLLWQVHPLQAYPTS